MEEETVPVTSFMDELPPVAPMKVEQLGPATAVTAFVVVPLLEPELELWVVPLEEDDDVVPELELVAPELELDEPVDVPLLELEELLDKQDELSPPPGPVYPSSGVTTAAFGSLE
jgi:hypothetical protein